MIPLSSIVNSLRKTKGGKFQSTLQGGLGFLRFIQSLQPSMEESSNQHQRSKRRLPPPPRAAPWLVYRHGKNRKFQTFCNIFDNPLNESYKKLIPELSGKRFWQKNCHQGWLIVVCDDDDDDDDNSNFNEGDCFLWNPSSLEIIMLPNLDHYNQLYRYRIRDCLLSSPPRSNVDGINGSSSSSSSSGSCSDSRHSGSVRSTRGNNDDSVVYILYDGGEKPDILIYCHPGEKEWRKHEFVDVDQRLKVKSLLSFKGKLLLMCLDDYAYFEIGSDIEDAETLSVSDAISVGSNFRLEFVAAAICFRRHQYYVEAFGEVFEICIDYIERGVYENCVICIIVCKLDFSTMTWEEVKSMDDYVFFLSRNSQLCCLASDLGLSKSCVYFTQKEELSLYKYDLEDDSILLSIPCPDLSSPWLSPIWLMITTPTRVDDRSKTTDRILVKAKDTDTVIKAVENRISVDTDDEEEDTEEARCWAMLNDDIIWSIASHLHTLDYIRLRAVSKRYRSIIRVGNLRRSSTTRNLQTTDIPLTPWLVFTKYDPEVHNFVNPVRDNENYLMHIPELLEGSRVRFSKGGWLLMARHKTLFFYNPFTKSSIKLPDLLGDDYLGYYLGISFSSLPTSSDCVVFAFYCDAWEGKVHISFIKRGDQYWAHHEFDNTYLPLHHSKRMGFEADFNNPVFHRGAFYCLDLNGALGAFNLAHDTSWGFLAMVPRPNCEFIYKSFLVECQGKLLSVLLGHLGKWVRIFRLNEIEMIWVQVKHLGRHMLFLSNTSCISAVAPTGSQMENKIYFPRLHNEGILYYSLDTGMYHSVGSTSHSAKDYRDSKENLHCSWIEPNWSETSDHYLDWLNI